MEPQLSVLLCTVFCLLGSAITTDALPTQNFATTVLSDSISNRTGPTFRTASLTPAVKKDLSSELFQHIQGSLIERQVTIQSATGFPMISITRPESAGSGKFPNVVITSGAPVLTNPNNNVANPNSTTNSIANSTSVLGVLQDLFQRVTNIKFQLPTLPQLPAFPAMAKSDLKLPVPPLNFEGKAKFSKEVTLIPQLTVPAFTIPSLTLALNVKPVDQQLAAEQAALMQQFEQEINKNNSANDRPFTFPYELFNTSSYANPEITSFPDFPAVEAEAEIQKKLYHLFEIMAAFIQQWQMSGAGSGPPSPLKLSHALEELPLVQRKTEDLREKAHEKAEPFHTVIPILEPPQQSNRKPDLPSSIRNASPKTASIKHSENATGSSKHKSGISPKPGKVRPVFGYQAAEYKPKQPSVNEQMNQLVSDIYRILLESYGLKRKEFN